jgi:hypothetical protein
MSSNPVATERHVRGWLAEYGYETVEEMQDFYGLTVDGVSGPQTTGAMNLPRCGCRDLRVAGNCMHVKKKLVYWHGRGFNLFKRGMGRAGRQASRSMINAGFAHWEAVSDFTFERYPEPDFDPAEVDIWIGGGKGPRYDFDGPGNVLAWAYMPCGSFDYLETRFDVQERWTANPRADNTWIYAMSVWLHELGHLLGLDHSRNADDIMAAYYNPDVRNLQPGDIQRIQQLYATPTHPDDTDEHSAAEITGQLPGEAGGD